MQTYDTVQYVQYRTAQYNAMRYVMWLHVTLHCIALHYATLHTHSTSHHITSRHIHYTTLHHLSIHYVYYKPFSGLNKKIIKGHQPKNRQDEYLRHVSGNILPAFGVFVRLVSILRSNGVQCSTSQPNKESLETSPSLTHNCNDSPGNAHNAGSDWSKASIW